MYSILHKAYHNCLKQDDLYSLVNLYKESQYWPINKIKQHQEQRTVELLKHAFENVPYYRNILTKIGLNLKEITMPENFSKIPFLTKDDIRKNYKQLIAQNVDQKYFKPNATSGSSGINLKFLSDASNLHGQALEFRKHEWMGLNFFDKKVTIWGASWDVDRTKHILPSIKKQLKRNIILSGYNLSDEMLSNYTKIISNYKPKILHSYPSILYTLAEFYENNNLSFHPRAILSAGEKLQKFQKEKIEYVFNSKIFDFYGARDIPMIAQECEKHNGLHIFMENILLEVVDDLGNNIENGEGELVLTHLHNKVMPFIRYKIGDRAKISQRSCSCGRNLPIIEEIIGRTLDIIEFPNGNKVGGTFWTLVMKSVPGILNFQIVQNNINEVSIQYISDGRPMKENIITLQNNILKFSGPGLKIEFNEVESIPVTKGGKYKYIISNISKG